MAVMEDSMFHLRSVHALLVTTLMLAGCSQDETAQMDTAVATEVAEPAVPESLPMGGEKSVMSFFVTSVGGGNGGDLGGLAGADAHCQALADTEFAGDHEWRAYLSAMPTETAPAVNARDRIGRGPWYNGEGTLVAANLEALHGEATNINKGAAVTQRLDTLNGVGDTPNMHDILTGSQSDGTAFERTTDSTCGNWTSSDNGSAQVGHHDRAGGGSDASSWNSAHPSLGCSQESLEETGGAGLIYCFGAD